MKLKCIIADDEPVARKGLAEDVKEIDFIEIVGIAENALQALDIINRQQPDLILLDIEMPKFNGLELIKLLQKPPMVIITTAYAGYALEGYHLDVIDYLLKPIAFNRLLKACNKAKELFVLRQKDKMSSAKEDSYFFIKHNGTHEKIFFNDVLLLEGANNYVTLHTVAKSYLTYQTLKNIAAALPAAAFIKVHKSYIVAIDKIDRIDGSSIIIQKHVVPISRNFKEQVIKKVVNTKMPGH